MRLPIVACEWSFAIALTLANADLNRFCGQDEYHDPGAEFEEVLACAVCGDNGKSSYPETLYSSKCRKIQKRILSRE